MSGSSQCAQILRELGVYVLGAITPADRAMVIRHLASCSRCREEVAWLAEVPALLRKVPISDVMQLPGDRPRDHSGPPEALLDGLIGRVAAVRRRRRWSLAVAAAVLVTAATAGWALHLQPAAQPHRAAASLGAAAAGGFNAATGARVAVRYTPQPWGTEVQASVSGIRPGTACQIWATTTSGQRAIAGGWTVTRSNPHAWYPASVPFPAGSLDSFDITVHGTVLVTIALHPSARPTPASATGAPSSIPVFHGRMSVSVAATV